MKKASRVNRFIDEAKEVGVDALDKGFTAAVAAIAGNAQLVGRLLEGFVVVFAELTEGSCDVVESAVEVLIS